MTGRNHTVRAALLALLTVLSVVGGGVAAADDGTATASVREAIEYDGNIELALDSSLGSPVGSGDVEVWVDGKSRSVDVTKDGTNGRIVLTGLDDVGPHRTLTVRVSSGSLDTGNVSVQITGTVLNEGGSGNFFPGTTIAFRTSDTGESLSITKEGAFIAERNTGTNSKIYVVDTDGQEVGPTYYVNTSSGPSSSYVLRDLGLTASANANEVEGGGSVSVSASSKGADRPLIVRLVDEGSGDVVATKDKKLGGDGTATIEFTDLSSGNYHVEIEDVITGVTASTATITVGSATGADAVFEQKVLSEQRGDVLAIPVSLEGPAAGGTVEVTLGSSDVNFQATVTAEDTDGDGTATVMWNTADSANATAGLWVQGGQGSVAVETGVDNPVTTGEYPLSLSYGGSETDVGTAVVEARSTDGVSVMTAPASVPGWQSVSDIRAGATTSNTFAMDRLTLSHDWLILRVEASGLSGYVDSPSDFTGSNGLSLTVEEADATVEGNENQATMGPSGWTLLAAPGEDTYYLLTQPQIPRNGEIEPGDKFDVTFTVFAGDNPVTESTQEVTTSFTVVNGTAGFEETPVTAPAASGAAVTGTSEFAAGTTLTVVLRSEGGQSPFVVDDEVVVEEDGTWTASFDLSEYEPGATFTARVSKADKGRVSAEGELVEEGATTTADGSDATTEPPAGTTQPPTTAPGSEPPGTDDETPAGPTPTSTPSPGFGVVVALAALLGALALSRRD